MIARAGEDGKVRVEVGSDDRCAMTGESRVRVGEGCPY